MKKIFVRIASALLLAAMLISVIACAETPNDPAETTEPVGVLTNDPAESVIEETTSINAENLLGIRDLSGETLTFYSRIYNGPWGSDLFVEDMDGAAGVKIFKIYGSSSPRNKCSDKYRFQG